MNNGKRNIFSLSMPHPLQRRNHALQLQIFYLFLLVLIDFRKNNAVSAACGLNPVNVISIRNDLAIALCSDRIARIFRGENASSSMAKRESLIIDPKSVSATTNFTDFQVDVNKDGIVIAVKTRAMFLQITHTGNESTIKFYDASRTYLFTREESASLSPNEKMVEQSWVLEDDESLHGGGQYLNDFSNYRGAPLHMVQFNTEIIIPFFVSSRGYALLWDNYGETWFNPPNRSNHLDLFELQRPKVVVLKNKKQKQKIRTARGTFSPPYSGDYWFTVDMQGEEDYFNQNQIIELRLENDDGFNKQQTRITACQVKEYNIPKVLVCRANNLKSNTTYEALLDYNSNMTPLVFFTSIDGHGKTKIQSKGDFIDYYIMIEADSVDQEDTHHLTTRVDSLIASYRKLTGSAVLFSKKAYGFWQCKEHYHNQSEILQSAKRHRDLGIPVDNIVQDWHYWGSLGWGPQWDNQLYPKPEEMIKKLHEDYFLSFMVSVWSRFDAKTRFYKKMKENMFLLQDSQWFDAWNPLARKLFYEFLDEAHFSIGVDAVWLDATEPENDPHLNKTVFLGLGNEYRNTYSLEVAKSFHQGYVEKYKTKRPFSLTRSSFAGQHRFASVIWSGDTTASFNSLKRQIAMSINYQISGDPYWTCDIGGFYRPNAQYTSKKYRLLLLRWFQFGVFIPIMRVHGNGTNTELWNYGDETQSLIVDSALNLRYRLMPYIYSGFWMVEKLHYTMGRAMFFDFAQDPFARDLSDQFMFGESFLVAPIYSPDSSRTVYLPKLQDKGAVWRDFYTGTVFEPGHYLAKNVGHDIIPLFVRSSIVVFAPKSQHVYDASTMTSLEVRVYVGKNAIFTLYEDDGIDPDPARPSTSIAFQWSEKVSKLCVGKRKGQQYPNMPQTRVIHVVLVCQGRGVGIKETANPDATAIYHGQELCIDLSNSHHEETMSVGYFSHLSAGTYTKISNS